MERNIELTYIEKAQADISAAVSLLQKTIDLQHSQVPSLVVSKSGEINAVFTATSKFNIDDAIASVGSALGLLNQAKSYIVRA